ncbi:MAG: hypothetical protein R2762_03100 [Bryobacteraceae bacterium]
MRNIVAIGMSVIFAFPGFGQEGELRVVVLQGDGAVNNIRRRAVSPVEVEVRDARNRAVEAAKVRFTLPELGPGGRFVDGSRTIEVLTDDRGRAGFSSFVPNGQEGRFSLAVDVAAGGREAGTAIVQSNSLFQYAAPRTDEPEVKRTGRGRALVLVLGIGVAATLGGVLASRGGGGPQSPPVSVGVGGVGVGGPR